MSLSRRQMVMGLGAGALGLTGLLAQVRPAEATVVLGGGPAGAAAALRLARAGATVTLVERDPTRLGGGTTLPAGLARAQAPVSLDSLRAAGVSVLLDAVTEVDWTAARLRLFSGRDLPFDALTMAPGTAPRPEAIAGLDARTRHLWPAAWGSAREGARLLGAVERLPEGGHIVLRLPTDVSHPEVALSRVAWLARAAADRAGHLTVLDAASATPLRRRALSQLPAVAPVTWLWPEAGGTVLSVDPDRGRLETTAGAIHADLVNFIGLQGAGAIARDAGLVDLDTGWCPVAADGRSTLRHRTWVLGDARAGAARTLQGAMASA